MDSFNKVLCLLVIFVCISLSGVVTRAQSIENKNKWFFSTDPYPPFVDGEDLGEVTGILMPYVEQVLCPQGDCVLRSQVRPWKRVLKDLEHGEIDLTGPMFADPQKSYLVYTDPLFSGRLKIWFKKGRSDLFVADDPMAVIRSLKFNGGIILGYSYTPEIDKIISVNDRKFTQYKSTPLALRALEDGRIDYFIGLDVVTEYYLRTMKFDVSSLTRSQSDISLGVYVLGISKKSKLAVDLKLLNERIHKLPFRDFVK